MAGADQVCASSLSGFPGPRTSPRPHVSACNASLRNLQPVGSTPPHGHLKTHIFKHTSRSSSVRPGPPRFGHRSWVLTHNKPWPLHIFMGAIGSGGNLGQMYQGDRRKASHQDLWSERPRPTHQLESVPLEPWPLSSVQSLRSDAATSPLVFPPAVIEWLGRRASWATRPREPSSGTATTHWAEE